jgi:hypothetical protein
MTSLTKKIYYKPLKSYSHQRLYKFAKNHDIIEENPGGTNIFRYFVDNDEVSFIEFCTDFKDEIQEIFNGYLQKDGISVSSKQENLNQYWYRYNFQQYYDDLNITPNWVLLKKSNTN